MTTTVTLRWGHISLQHAADPHAVARYIAATIREHDLDGGTTTECQHPRILEIVRDELGPDWWVRQGREYLIFGRLKGARVTIRPAKKTKIRVRRLTHVYSGHSSWRDTYIATQMCRVLVDGKLVRRVLVTAAHLPSGVEKPGGMKANSQTKTHRRAVPKWGAAIRSKARAVTERASAFAARRGIKIARGALRVKVIAGMDCNLNQHDANDRDYMRRNIGMPGIWDNKRPRGGTHGRRLIDTIHTTARVIDSGIVRVDPKRYDGRIDHRGVWAELAVGRKARGGGRR